MFTGSYLSFFFYGYFSYFLVVSGLAGCSATSNIGLPLLTYGLILGFKSSLFLFEHIPMNDYNISMQSL